MISYANCGGGKECILVQTFISMLNAIWDQRQMSFILLKECIPEKHKLFGLKLYKLCDSMGYTYNMIMYLGKDRKCAPTSMIATHATVTGLAVRIEHVGHRLYMDNFFSSPALFGDLHTKTAAGLLGQIEKRCQRILDFR
jgi:hypothetical protein